MLAGQQMKVAGRVERYSFLLFADFDGLKGINDAFGYSEGARALSEVADVPRKTFREADIIARIGGDEFVVLTVEADEASTEVLIARLQENLGVRNAGQAAIISCR